MFSSRKWKSSTQPVLRWVFRRVDLGFRCPSDAQIECSEWHFPMGRGLGDWFIRRVTLTDACKSRQLHFDGFIPIEGELPIAEPSTYRKMSLRTVDLSFRYPSTDPSQEGFEESKSTYWKKIVDVRMSIVSSPRYLSDIYAEQEEGEIRTHVLTILKLTSTRWSKYNLIF